MAVLLVFSFLPLQILILSEDLLGLGAAEVAEFRCIFDHAGDLHLVLRQPPFVPLFGNGRLANKPFASQLIESHLR